MQVEIAKEHGDFIRFLRFKYINETPRKTTSFRFTRVVFGLASSPFLPKQTIRIYVLGYLPLPYYNRIEVDFKLRVL